MNSFGNIFRVSLFGESHGSAVGAVLDNVPPGIPLSSEDFVLDMNRRKSGKKGTTPRLESDIPDIVSGVHEGLTTGAPIMIMIKNENTRSKDYSLFREMPRPGHSDFTAQKKYGGFNDLRGGGMFSARLTTAIVAAGVVAKKICSPVNYKAEIVHIGGNIDIEAELDSVMKDKDSIGGLVKCTGINMPIGLGEPFFGKFEAQLAHIMFSLPAVKAFEIGSGVKAALMRGSEHNDCFSDENGKTLTNNSGGTLGGITNGNSIEFSVTFKPTASISIPQKTFNFEKGKIDTLIIEGRHDACLTLRTPVIVEACAAIVTADLLLYNRIYG
ncbi:MAG TPA: chorismate synthase [Spirochaetota bacterium]|nr:chorismate synthase [Spirochaetota bacterium]